MERKDLSGWGQAYTLTRVGAACGATYCRFFSRCADPWARFVLHRRRGVFEELFSDSLCIPASGGGVCAA